MSELNIDEITIREADESDAEMLALLLAELGYPTKTIEVIGRLKEISETDDFLLAAVDGSKVIGMVLLHRTRFLHRRPDGRISTLVVFESYRGRGIGARLVAAAESIFRQWNCGRIEVTSGAQRTAAHRFYERAGYIEKPRRFVKLLPDLTGKN